MHTKDRLANAQREAGFAAYGENGRSRLARRLMRLCTMSEQSKFAVTQDALAEMFGVRRNSVSMIAHTMLEANVIRYARGLVEIVDVDRLHRPSCECYDTVTA